MKKIVIYLTLLTCPYYALGMDLVNIAQRVLVGSGVGLKQPLTDTQLLTATGTLGLGAALLGAGDNSLSKSILTGLSIFGSSLITAQQYQKYRQNKLNEYLHKAIRQNDVEKVQTLIHQKANVNYRTEFDDSMLYIASKIKPVYRSVASTKIIELLINNGAEDYYKCCKLSIALDYNCSFSTIKKVIDEYHKKGYNSSFLPPRVTLESYALCYTKSSQTIQELIKLGGDVNIYFTMYYGNIPYIITPLMMNSSKLTNLKILVQCGASPDYFFFETKQRTFTISFAQCLLEDERLEYANYQAPSGETPLIYIIKLMCEQDVDYHYFNPHTLLTLAAQNKHINVNATDHEGNSSLMIIAQKWEPAIEFDPHNRYPEDYAIRKIKRANLLKDILILLINAKADLTLVNNKGKTCRDILNNRKNRHLSLLFDEIVRACRLKPLVPLLRLFAHNQQC